LAPNLKEHQAKLTNHHHQNTMSSTSSQIELQQILHLHISRKNTPNRPSLLEQFQSRVVPFSIDLIPQLSDEHQAEMIATFVPDFPIPQPFSREHPFFKLALDSLKFQLLDQRIFVRAEEMLPQFALEGLKRLMIQTLDEKLAQQSETLNEKLDQTLNEKLAQQSETLNEKLAQQSETLNEKLAQQSETLNEKLDQTLNEKLAQQSETFNEKLGQQSETLIEKLDRHNQQLLQQGELLATTQQQVREIALESEKTRDIANRLMSGERQTTHYWLDAMRQASSSADLRVVDELFQAVDGEVVSNLWKKFTLRVKQAIERESLATNRVEFRLLNGTKVEMSIKKLLASRDANYYFPSEPHCQAWFVWVFQQLRELDLQFAFKPVDTSSSRYPLYPEFKFDFSMCPLDSISAVQLLARVNWYDVISFIELKKDMTDQERFRQLMLQVSSGNIELFNKHSTRLFATTGTSDSSHITWYVQHRVRSPTASPALPLFQDLQSDSPPPGFTLLVRYLMTSPQKLGFPASPPLTIDSPLLPPDCIITPIRIHHPDKTDVFAVNLPASDAAVCCDKLNEIEFDLNSQC
jgi:hypothetical protein